MKFLIFLLISAIMVYIAAQAANSLSDISNTERRRFLCLLHISMTRDVPEWWMSPRKPSPSYRCGRRKYLYAAGDLTGHHRRTDQERRCPGSRPGGRHYGCQTDICDHPDVPSSDAVQALISILRPTQRECVHIKASVKQPARPAWKWKPCMPFQLLH